MFWKICVWSYPRRFYSLREMTHQTCSVLADEQFRLVSLRARNNLNAFILENGNSYMFVSQDDNSDLILSRGWTVRFVFRQMRHLTLFLAGWWNIWTVSVSARKQWRVSFGSLDTWVVYSQRSTNQMCFLPEVERRNIICMYVCMYVCRCV